MSGLAGTQIHIGDTKFKAVYAILKLDYHVFVAPVTISF